MGSGPWALWLRLLVSFMSRGHKMVTNHKEASFHIDFALPCASYLLVCRGTLPRRTPQSHT